MVQVKETETGKIVKVHAPVDRCTRRIIGNKIAAQYLIITEQLTQLHLLMETTSLRSNCLADSLIGLVD